MSTAHGEASDRRLWFDIGLACVVPGVQLVLLVATGALRPWSPSDAVTVGLVLAQGVPLAARRAAPWAVFSVVLVANTVYYGLGLPPTGYDLGLAVALYTVAERGSLRAALTAYGAVLVVVLAMKLGAVGPYWSRAPWFLVTYLCVFFGAAWTWGRYQHVRAARVADLVRDAEREQRAVAEAAVRSERNRIARELHDVIAHHLSLMVVQAGGARRVLDRDPARAREALGVIEEYGRRGLEAMPGLLAALREEPTGGEDYAPAPRLSEVDALVDQLARSGVDVTLTVDGAVRPLPAGVELAAYRIVQEALTNATRHAPGTAVAVTVRYRPDAVCLTVADGGRGLAATVDTGGHGLLGMRERARLQGGRVQLGRSAAGGCLVSAWFPCPQGAS